MLKPPAEFGRKISYARSCDGVHIAYWTGGSGEPLVFLPTLVSNVENEMEGARGRVHRVLMEHHQVIRYDGRGHGMSDRNPERLTLDALVDDLLAVVDDLKLPKIALFAPSIAATTAIAFAARYPERVTRLGLWMPYPSYGAYFGSSVSDALALARANWDLFTKTISHIRVGWVDSSQAMSGARMLLASVNQDFYLREVDSAGELDATPYLKDIRVPTLVICRRDYGDYEMNMSRSLAAAIPTAKFSIVDGNENGILDERMEAMREIQRFFGVDVQRPAVEKPLPEYLQNRSQELSRREIDVLRYLANGHRNKEIAVELGLSVYTVARHVATIYAKIGAHGRAEATRYALEHGILPPRESAHL